jgi:hypothetical protein
MLESSPQPNKVKAIAKQAKRREALIMSYPFALQTTLFSANQTENEIAPLARV